MPTNQQNSHWPLTLMTSATSLLNLALPLILIRLLPTKQIGIYKLFFLYFGLLPWVLLFAGVNQSLAVWRSSDFKEQQKKYTAGWITLHFWSLFIIIATLILGYFFSLDFMFYAIGIGVALASSSQFFEESLIAQGHLRAGAMWIASFEILKITILISMAYFYRNIDVALKYYLVALLIKFFLSLIFTFHRQFINLKFINLEKIFILIKQILPLSLSAALAIIIGYADHLILSRHLTLDQYALYAMGCLVVPPLYMLEQGINKELLPRLVITLQNSKEEAQKLLSQAISELSLFLIPASLGLYFFAEPIINLLLTSRYSSAAIYLKIFSFSYLLFIIPFDMTARALGFNRWIFKISLLAALIIGSSLIILKNLLDPAQLLIIMLLLQLLLRIIGMQSSIKWLQSRWLILWPWQFQVKITFLSVALGWLTWTLYDLNPQPLNLFLQIILFALIYFYFALPWYLKTRSQIKETPTNVLMLTQYLHLGGLEQMLLNLSHDINPHSFKVSIFVYDQLTNTPVIDQKFSPLPVFRMNKNKGFSFRVVLKILKICWQQNTFIIHAHDLGALIYASLARLISLGHIKVIYTVHSLVHLSKSKNYVWYEKFFYWLTNYTVLVSPSLKTQYQQQIGNHPVTLINNGIPLQKIKSLAQQFTPDQLRKQFSEAYHIPNRSDDQWLVSIARLHPGKGQDQLIKLWAKLPKELQLRVHLIFVGEETSPDYQSKLQSLINIHQAQHHVHLIGPSHQTALWLHAADAFVSGSVFEGLPLSVLEALAVNTPVILSDIAGHQIFSPVAFYFDTMQIDEGALQLSHAINQLSFISPIQLDQWIQGFDITQMSTQYQSLYQKVKL